MARGPEAEFQAWITGEAVKRGVKVSHDPDSRRQVPGEPDLFLLSARGFAWVEVKAPKGILRDEQREWHNLLTLAGGRCLVVAPGDEPQVTALLDQLAPQNALGCTCKSQMGNRSHATQAARPAPLQPQLSTEEARAGMLARGWTPEQADKAIARGVH